VVLDRAARLVKPGGRVVYVTCSVLPEENDEAVSGLLEQGNGFTAVRAADVLARAGLGHLAGSVRLTRYGLQMTPRLTGTDGFYVAELQGAP
jgi:16S rRNA (cytosine967-C5)-methyltransferase